MTRKQYKPKTPPKITYQFVESADAKERLLKIYEIVFDAVLNSQDWGPELNALKKKIK